MPMVPGWMSGLCCVLNPKSSDDLSLETQGILALSDEVLVLVLSFLESDGDLISCSQVSKRFRRLASDKSLVKRLNFRRDFSLNRDNFKSFFSIPATCAKVLSLNLNGVYWIPPGVLQAQIIKMRNLQELHVGDVLFSARQFSKIVASLGDLKKLSLSWHWEFKGEVEEITKPGLASVYGQLEELNIYLATLRRCPLDRVTWLLALCRNLVHITVLSKTLNREVVSNNSYRWMDRVPSIRDFHLPALQSVLWDLSNNTFPLDLVMEIEGKLRSFAPARNDETDYGRNLLKTILDNFHELNHFECRDGESDGGILLEGLARHVPQVERMMLSKVVISPRHSKSLTKLFLSCVNLSYLELTDINCPTQRLLEDLELGLKAAKRLKTLKILQEDLTQYSPGLLDSLAENSDRIEQVVLVDTSKAFTLEKYPIKKLVKVAEKKSSQFIYICSELLTREDVRFIKRNIKPLLVQKPYLVVKLQSQLGEKFPPVPFYNMEDVGDLPMEFQLSVTSLSAQDPTFISVNDIF